MYIVSNQTVCVNTFHTKRFRISFNPMDMFAERLKDLREERGLSLTALAQDTGFTQAAIGRWESKKRIPNIETLIVFAKYFKVTTDYLLGLEN